jgi:hypothetical protein
MSQPTGAGWLVVRPTDRHRYLPRAKPLQHLRECKYQDAAYKMVFCATNPKGVVRDKIKINRTYAERIYYRQRKTIRQAQISTKAKVIMHQPIQTRIIEPQAKEKGRWTPPPPTYATTCRGNTRKMDNQQKNEPYLPTKPRCEREQVKILLKTARQDQIKLLQLQDLLASLLQPIQKSKELALSRIQKIVQCTTLEIRNQMENQLKIMMDSFPSCTRKK